MNKWILWTVICIICISVLLYIGTFFRYPVKKLKAHIFVCQVQQDYKPDQKLLEKKYSI